MTGSDNQSRRQTLQEIIDRANGKWVEAHTAESLSEPPSPEHTARKGAFDDIMHHCRQLLESKA